MNTRSSKSSNNDDKGKKRKSDTIETSKIKRKANDLEKDNSEKRKSAKEKKKGTAKSTQPNKTNTEEKRNHSINIPIAENEIEEFIKNIDKQRHEVAESVETFHFNKKRVRVLSKSQDVPQNAKAILYWMCRDQRVQDNWALLYAQRLALKLKLPLHICFCVGEHLLERTLRHFDFMLSGLEEVAYECESLGIKFHLFNGKPGDIIPDFIQNNNFGALVVDFTPLREPLQWLDSITKQLPSDIPIVQVDAHNIVPCWQASDKLEFGAYTIRPKITKILPEYLTEFPPVIQHLHKGSIKTEKIDWKQVKSSLKVDNNVKPVAWAKPGPKAALIQLASFLFKKIRVYAEKRNNPNNNATSRISPWLHFGSISAQRCVLEARVFKAKSPESVASFLEEITVRRELADNFCWNNKDIYDKFEGAHNWAQTTLNAHRKDKRQWIYTLKDLQAAKTHEDLWNSAQKQLAQEGHLHGFLRMYWAKKILEWSSSPEEALKNSLWLNDYYSLDGNDPNGFVGCMWSVCGVHDRAWKERPIFGKIRYMNYNGCKNKFKIDEFVLRYP